MTPVLPDIDFDQYTVGQRLQLIERIWDTISEKDFVVPESHKELIRQRLAEREANPGTGRPWKESIREIQSEGRDHADR